jgi:hypothetical protein
VSRLLRALRWTPQTPIRRAIQRDDEAIARWHTDVWPELRWRSGRSRRALVFVDECGYDQLPGKVKIYAPEGHTPVLDEWLTRDHLSVMGGLTPAGKVYVLMQPESLNNLHAVAFLQHLTRHTGRSRPAQNREGWHATMAQRQGG